LLGAAAGDAEGQPPGPGTGDGADIDSAGAAVPPLPTASDRALAALRVFPGLEALEVEDETSFAATVEAFYDARYGAGWTQLRTKSLSHADFWRGLGGFLSQWYKVTACHGLLRRWSRANGVEPLAVVRVRLDHLLTVQWNLTAAHAEFSARPAALAAGGNFLALWGPSAHSEFCADLLCGDTFVTKVGSGPGAAKCFHSGRLDDAFAFGTPAAFDGYIKKQHFYARGAPPPARLKRC
jgi:hypothetical protein